MLSSLIRRVKSEVKNNVKRIKFLEELYYYHSSRLEEVGGERILIPPERGIKITDEAEFLKSMEGKKCIWDVGAHIGSISVYLSSKFEKVIAFEPDPKNLKFLKKNAKKEGCENIKCVELALGSKNGKEIMHSEMLAGSGMSSFSGKNKLKREFEVDCKKIDKVVEKIDKPDVIKLDVEGAEADVLRGAKNTLEEEKIEWVIEMHTSKTNQREDLIRKRNSSYKKIYNMLRDSGHKISCIKNGSIKEFDIKSEDIPLYWYARKL